MATEADRRIFSAPAIFIFLCFFCCASISAMEGYNGLSTSPFLQLHNVVEITCSGAKLPASVDLLSMSLYERHHLGGRHSSRMLASVNFGAKKCLTNSSFTSCRIDESNSRRTELRSLVTGLGTGELRHYGCNVTGFQSGGKTPVFTWFTSARFAESLSAHVFHNIDHVLEVTCAGDVLDPTADLLTLSLYSNPERGQNNRDILASVNLRKYKCVSSTSFASCQVNNRDSLKTNLKILVMDLRPGEVRTFGCTAGYELNTWLQSKSWTLALRRNRLKTSVFEKHPLIQQVTCSGETLDSGSALLTMTLYSPAEVKSNVIATISIVKRKCTTSSAFSSCLLDERDSSSSRLRTLVTDLGVGERRTYGCTVGYETGGWPKTVTWSIAVSRNRLTARAFHDIPAVVEVGCSGAGLDPGNDVFMIVLRSMPSKTVLASVNTKSKKCLTFSSFSSCSLAGQGDSRRVGVKTLIMGMEVGQVRRFACNVTFASGVWESGVQTWTLHVRRNVIRVASRAFVGGRSENSCIPSALVPIKQLPPTSPERIPRASIVFSRFVHVPTGTSPGSIKTFSQFELKRKIYGLCAKGSNPSNPTSFAKEAQRHYKGNNLAAV
ncbi:hypothetical protein ACOMHN_035407 [Nucella lapillus]